MVEGLNSNYNLEYKKKIILRLFTELLESGKEIVTVCVPLYLHKTDKISMYNNTINITKYTFEQFYSIFSASDDIYNKIHDENSEILWDKLNKTLKTPIKVIII